MKNNAVPISVKISTKKHVLAHKRAERSVSNLHKIYEYFMLSVLTSMYIHAYLQVIYIIVFIIVEEKRESKVRA